MSEEGGGGGARQEIETARDPWHSRQEKMRCRTCRFYVQKASAQQASGELGRCRRNAPTMQGFPVVFPLDWCGEHKLDENRV